MTAPGLSSMHNMKGDSICFPPPLSANLQQIIAEKQSKTHIVVLFRIENARHCGARSSRQLGLCLFPNDVNGSWAARGS